MTDASRARYPTRRASNLNAPTTPPTATMASLADIWDAPAEEVTRRATPPIDLTANDSPPRGPKRPRSTLFLDSDSEGEGSAQPARKSAPPAAKRSEIDAMFDNLDAEPDAFDDDLPPALDLDALRRQADAKNAQIYKKPSALDLGGPSEDADVGGDAKSKGSGQEKQKKKPLPKLDEARVLGPDGFPALLKQAKTFKPKGKGHEVRYPFSQSSATCAHIAGRLQT